MDINRFLEVREDPTAPLFHYTSIPKLVSILDSRTLWATDVQYMNDAQELKHGIAVLRSLVDARLPQLSDKQKKCAEQLRRWSSDGGVSRHHIFATCFTEKGNLLSQWRSYCTSGKGVSIAFAPDELIEAVYEQGFRLSRVLYQREEQLAIIGYLVDALLESAYQYEEPEPKEAHPTQTFYALFEEWTDTIAHICAMMKHSAFAEESEWRAISSPIQDLKDPRFRFRDGSMAMTPYIELKLPQNGQNGVSFEAAFLGPAANHNLAFRSLTTLFTAKGATIRRGVTACQIPLRT